MINVANRKFQVSKLKRAEEDESKEEKSERW